MNNHNTDLFRYSPPPAPYETDDSNEITDAEDDDDSDVDNRYHHPHTEFTEMKEQMYQAKLADLKRQLVKLNDESLPEYQKKLRKLDAMYRERLRFNEVIKDLEVEMVEKEFIREKKSAFREFEDQKVYLKDQVQTISIKTYRVIRNKYIASLFTYMLPHIFGQFFQIPHNFTRAY